MLMASSSSNYSHLLLFSSRSPSIPIPSSKFHIRLLSPRMIHSRRQPLVMKEKSSAMLGFSDSFKKGFNECSIHLLQRNSRFGSIPRRCNKDWGSEGEAGLTLEAQILKFMDCSENPNKFPTKKDLINAGRGDLVEAIEKIRDWLSKGWDLEDKEEEVEEDLGSGFLHSDDRMFQERCFNGGECDSLEEVDVGIIASEDSSLTPPSSGREMEKEEEEEEKEEEDEAGILIRLEKERNLSFGFGSRKKEIDVGDDLSCKNVYEDEWKLGSSMSAEIGLDEATDNRCFNGGECDSLEEVDVGIIASEDSSSSSSSSSTPSSSGIEMEKEEEERNLSFGFGSCKNVYEDDWKLGSSMGKLMCKIWHCLKKSHSEAVISLESYIYSWRELWASYVESNQREYEHELKSVFPNYNPPDHPRRSLVFMTTLEEKFYDFVFEHARWFIKTITAPLWQVIVFAVGVLGIPVGFIRLAIFGVGAIVNALFGNVLSHAFMIVKNVSMKWKVTQPLYPKPPRPKELKEGETQIWLEEFKQEKALIEVDKNEGNLLYVQKKSVQKKSDA